MIRNGLLTFIAVLMALALIVRLENTAQAQIGYSGTINGVFSRFPDLGYIIHVDNNGSGISRITENPLRYPPILDPLAIGGQTNNQADTVFTNLSGTSYINTNPRGEISTTTDAPAIMNGMDDSTNIERDRVYVIQLQRLQGDDVFQVTYGFRYADDPVGTFRPLSTIPGSDPATGGYDMLPEEVRNLEFPADSGNILWSDDPGRGTTATIPAGYFFDDSYFVDEETGAIRNVVVFDNRMITLRQRDDTSPTGWVSVNFVDEVDEELPSAETGSGGYTQGYLVINNRNDVGRKDGDDRTIISSAMGAAIENHGTLTVNDAKIQGSTAGILGEYARGRAVDTDGNVIGYVNSTGNNILLNNTQIGTPGRTLDYYFEESTNRYYIRDSFDGRWYYYDYDPNTGTRTYGGLAANFTPPATGGIILDPFGKPIQTTSYITPGQKLNNGRMIAGNSVTLNRNTIGSLYHSAGKTAGTDSEVLVATNNLNYITGPNIGIHTRAHSFYLSPMDLVYTNSGYYSQRYYVGVLDTPGAGYGIYNFIELRDNSWIFANTGISFGNTADDFLEESSIRVVIDKTSGIFATGGTGYIGLLYYSGSGAGITDRYSLLGLNAVSGTDSFPVLDGYTYGYSGSWHEIDVQGKVITGAPSLSGVQFRFNSLADMSPADKNKFRNVYY